MPFPLSLLSTKAKAKRSRRKARRRPSKRRAPKKPVAKRTPPKRTTRPKPRPPAPLPSFSSAAPVVAAPPPEILAVPPAAAVPAAPRVGAPPPTPPAALPVTTMPVVAPAPPAAPDLPVYDGPFGAAEATRLLWRAGFGPAPGEAQAVAALGLPGAVDRLLRVSGEAALHGPEPRTETGDPLAPADLVGHDLLWWLDRMVRSDQPLVERMTLVWHDWFATVGSDVEQPALVLAQNATLRRHALGRFEDLLRDVTQDPAMLVFLSGANSPRNRPNENYARELMELFTLGADRGAYSETDVREMARALTGFRASFAGGTGWSNFRFEPAGHDTGPKTIFGRTGTWGWTDAVRLCVEHPAHPSYFVTKLWSAFIPTVPDEATIAALARRYVATDGSIGAVLRAILLHPALHRGTGMVKPPAVLAAGLLRAAGRGIDTSLWVKRCQTAGQRLFEPPDVSGWDERAWLDTARAHARWNVAAEVLKGRVVTTWKADETPQEAVAAALDFWGDPPMTQGTRDALLAFATSVPNTASAERQNALRQLVAACPDAQIS